MSKIRTFVAVEAPAEIRRRAADLVRRLDVTPARVKWVDMQNMHWTLKFLGDVEDRQIPKVCQSVQQAVDRQVPFAAQAQGAGAFPTAQRPRTLWLGVSAGGQEFVRLHDAVEASLAAIGIRSEHRRFRPHLTIGRVRHSPQGIDELGNLVLQNADFPAGAFTVGEVVIMASQLDRQGPHYQVLGRAILGG